MSLSTPASTAAVSPVPSPASSIDGHLTAGLPLPASLLDEASPASFQTAISPPLPQPPTLAGAPGMRIPPAPRSTRKCLSPSLGDPKGTAGGQVGRACFDGKATRRAEGKVLPLFGLKRLPCRPLGFRGKMASGDAKQAGSSLGPQPVWSPSEALWGFCPPGEKD